jgi:hypothetical protein
VESIAILRITHALQPANSPGWILMQTKTNFLVLAVFLTVVPAHAQVAALPSNRDERNLANGYPIPSEGYADQPYIVKTEDGAWLCAITTGAGHEGAGGQHVVSMRSTDRGLTWEKPVDIEPADGPEASYVVLLKTSYGRVYALYNHNTDCVREVKREDQGVYKRVDSLGHYVFKYSDDHGRSWSAQRYDIPVREFECDRNNVYAGKLRFFWNVGRPLILGDSALMTLHKVGAMGEGFFAQSEGVFLKSDNILSQRDPTQIRFETLPDGDIGLRTPVGGGRIAEEQSIVKLSDSSIFCVYRTIDGWPACAYSRDGGHTWSAPEYLTYTPGGARVKHPRAANFIWNCSNGKFLYWFHNHGGPFIARMAPNRPDRINGSPYDDRNPAWLMAGREIDTPAGKQIEWSQPEIVLYDDDPYIRMSYPDLVEEVGQFFITETQKNTARLHPIANPLVEGLFQQWDNRAIARDGLVKQVAAGSAVFEWPRLPSFNVRDSARADFGAKDNRAGFSIDLWLNLDSLQPGQVLLDNRNQDRSGFALLTAQQGALRFLMNDGRQEVSWESDPGTIAPGKPQHAVITIDGGPKIITYVINGILCDGGESRQFGWGRFSPTLRTPQGAKTMTISDAVRSLRIYNRALRTSEAVAHFRAGPDQ